MEVRYRVPGDVVFNILAFCEASAANAIMRSSRANYHLGTPFLYKHVKVYTPEQAHRLAACVQAVKSEPATRNYFRPMETFTYALEATVISGDDVRKDINAFHVLSKIPAFNLDLVPLFPKLAEAFFYPLPTLDPTDRAPESTSFLHKIRRLHLLWMPDSAYSDIPACHALGMTSLQSVSLYHFMGAEKSRWPIMRDYLGFQPHLNSAGVLPGRTCVTFPGSFARRYGRLRV